MSVTTSSSSSRQLGRVAIGQGELSRAEEDLDQAMLDESRKIGTFGHGYTYTAHPVGCAVALKAIEIDPTAATVPSSEGVCRLS